MLPLWPESGSSSANMSGHCSSPAPNLNSNPIHYNHVGGRGSEFKFIELWGMKTTWNLARQRNRGKIWSYSMIHYLSLSTWMSNVLWSRSVYISIWSWLQYLATSIRSAKNLIQMSWGSINNLLGYYLSLGGMKTLFNSVVLYWSVINSIAVFCEKNIHYVLIPDMSLRLYKRSWEEGEEWQTCAKERSKGTWCGGWPTCARRARG